MQAIEMTLGDRTLRGARYMGQGRGTVLIAHGFGDNRMGAGRILVQFARALAGAGFAVLALDRAGHGESDGAFYDISVPDEIGQLSAMADLVPGPLHLAGHSLGAMELATLAGRRPDKTASLTLWAPAASSVAQVRRGVIMERPIDPLLRGAPFDFHGQALGPAFVEGMAGYDPFAGLDAYGGPVHLHHGSADEIQDVASSHRYAAIWPQAAVRIYAGADHGWTCLAARQALIAASVEQIAAAARGA